VKELQADGEALLEFQGYLKTVTIGHILDSIVALLEFPRGTLDRFQGDCVDAASHLAQLCAESIGARGATGETRDEPQLFTWRELRHMGWFHVRGVGLQDWLYVRPGADPKVVNQASRGVCL
jgi:hypothetical protein